MARPRSTETSRRRWPRLVAVLLALVLLVGGGLWYLTRGDSRAAGVSKDRYGDLIQTVPAGEVPIFAQEAGPDVARVYRFAASEEGKVLEWIPCFCGCGKIGHQHNRHCYVQGAADGNVTFTSHGGG